MSETKEEINNNDNNEQQLHHQKLAARPNPITTLQGMIYNANHCLDIALDPRTHDVPIELLKRCHGIIFISIIEVGFIFSGNVGTGIVMAKKQQQQDGDGDDDRSSLSLWSAPSAVGLAGVGFGFLAGAGVKDAMIFIMDKFTMGTFARDAQIKIGAQFSNTRFVDGREMDASAAGGINRKGISAGGTLSYSFSQGFMIGVSLEGAVLCKRDRANQKFYGEKRTVGDILADYGTSSADEETGIPDIHRKLNRIAQNKKGQPTHRDVQKWEQIRKKAQQAAEDAQKDGEEDLEFVDSTSMR